MDEYCETNPAVDTQAGSDPVRTTSDLIRAAKRLGYSVIEWNQIRDGALKLPAAFSDVCVSPVDDERGLASRYYQTYMVAERGLCFWVIADKLQPVKVGDMWSYLVGGLHKYGSRPFSEDTTIRNYYTDQKES